MQLGISQMKKVNSSTKEQLTSEVPIRDSKSGKFGFITKSGKIIVPYIYDAAASFNEGAAWVFKDNKFAFINEQGNLITEWMTLTQISDFHDGLARIAAPDNKSGYKYGYIDKTGKTIIQTQYDRAFDFQGGLAYVEKNKEGRFINTTGATAITMFPKYEYAGNCDDGLIRFKQNNRLGFMDKNGKIVLPAIYYFVGIFYDGITEIRDSLTENMGVINKKGDTIVPIIFDQVGIRSKNLISVKVRDRAGFLDKKGNMVIPMVFDYAAVSESEFGTASLDGENYKVYKQDNLIKVKLMPKANDNMPPIDINNDSSKDLQDGYFHPPYQYYGGQPQLAPVIKNGKIGFINKENKLVIPFIYKYSYSFSGNLVAVHNGKKWGFINSENKVIVPFIYDKVLRFQADITIGWIGKKQFSFTKTGEPYQ